MREALVKANDAGKEKSGPRNGTSARIRSSGARKMLRPVWIIPLSGVENQIKSDRGRSLYHTEHPSCDFVDVSTGSRPIVNMCLGRSISVTLDSRTLRPFAVSIANQTWLVFLR